MALPKDYRNVVQLWMQLGRETIHELGQEFLAAQAAQFRDQPHLPLKGGLQDLVHHLDVVVHDAPTCWRWLLRSPCGGHLRSPRYGDYAQALAAC
jgi:hypothetical protein